MQHQWHQNYATAARLFCRESHYTLPKVVAPWLQSASENLKSDFDSGVLAQLVERLNGIEEVRGSNPLGSTISRSENIKQSGDENLFEGGARSARVKSEAQKLEPKLLLWIIP